MSALKFRRVVTGPDSNGMAVVQYDDLIEGKSTSPTNTVTNFWTTDGFPMQPDYESDRGADKIPREPPPQKSVFRYVTIEPGNQRDMHTTKSIGFAVVVSGEIDMELNEVAQQCFMGGKL